MGKRMVDFHLVPFRFYKVLLAAAAVAAPIIYYVCVAPLSHDDIASRLFAYRVV